MYRKYGKRLTDVAVAIVLLPLVLLSCFIVGVMIKLDDGGPVFHTAERRGFQGRIFKMWKFRSMTVGAAVLKNEDGSTLSSRFDPRVTRVGKVIRAMSLDELPQLLNVLKGDMSLNGSILCISRLHFLV